MRAQGIVKGFNIGENIRLSSTAGVIPAQVNQFALEAAEKVLRHSVVVGVAFADMLCRTPSAASRSRKASAAYWTPLSLWKIRPGLGRWRRTAMSDADRDNCVLMRQEKA